MPYSHSFYKQDIKSFIDKTVSKKSKILDVGPGNGTYSALLKPLGYELDCLEIFEPYIEKYNLSEKYNKVILGNIVYFDIEDYDFIILGDILEHLSREDAKNILNRLKDKCKELIVVVPYYLPQDEVFGNKYEIHLQPDLDDEIMAEHYPMLEMINLHGKELKIPIDMGTHYYYYCAFKKRV
jgi:SAM-dependent methyltransferase